MLSLWENAGYRVDSIPVTWSISTLSSPGWVPGFRCFCCVLLVSRPLLSLGVARGALAAVCARRVDTHASLSSPPARRISPPLAAAAPTPVLIVCHSEHDYLPHFFTVWLRFFCYLLRSCSTFQPCIKILYLKTLVIKYCLCPLRTPCLPFGK